MPRVWYDVCLKHPTSFKGSNQPRTKITKALGSDAEENIHHFEKLQNHSAMWITRNVLLNQLPLNLILSICTESTKSREYTLVSANFTHSWNCTWSPLRSNCWKLWWKLLRCQWKRHEYISLILFMQRHLEVASYRDDTLWMKYRILTFGWNLRINKDHIYFSHSMYICFSILLLSFVLWILLPDKHGTLFPFV